MLTTIANGDAPEDFTYKVDVPEGGSLNLTPTGVVEVKDVAGAVLRAVGPAYAKDASGRDVPTYFTVDGDRLTQHVSHSGGGFTYPVVADPWWGIQIRVSSASANRISALLNMGAGGSGIAAAACSGTVVGIPCGIAWAVAGGVQAIGGGIVSWCNARGRGIIVNVLWTGHSWCTSQ